MVENTARTTTKMRIVFGGLAFVALGLIGLGSFVRATGAGMACPDWPLCFNKVVPPFEPGVAQEYFHRVLAGLEIAGCFFALMFSFRLKAIAPRYWRVSLFLFGLLIVQAILGGLTVILTLSPLIVTLHLLTGTAVFQLAAMNAILPPQPGPLQFTLADVPVLGMVALLFLQLAVAGIMGNTGASLACPDFPLCSGSLVPGTVEQQIHMLHRLLGVLIILNASFVGWMMSQGHTRWSRRSGIALAALALVQVLLGIGNIFFRLQLHVVITHVVFAQLLFLMTMVLLLLERGREQAVETA